MILSVCIPCMNRTYDLKKTMPYIIDAANHSPPVEIFILDYNSQDDLEEYKNKLRETINLVDGNELTYFKYIGRDYYHMAHARNLAILESKGHYAINFCADVIPNKRYFEVIRTTLRHDDYLWLRHDKKFVGIIVCRKDEFISAGGFDERFEFYSKEDKDLIARLERRGGKYTTLPRLLRLIPTPNEDKTKNYRLKISKREMGKIAKRIYEENIRNNVLVANEGKEWGRWG